MDLLFPQLVALAATFITTLTGFGFALTMIPLMMMATDAKAAVIITLLLYTFAGSIVTWNARKDLDRPLLTTLLISSHVGLPAGAYILVMISDSLLRLVVGALIVAASLLLFFNYQRPFGNQERAAVVVGFLGGLMNSSVVVCGPFVVLFLANQKMEKHRLRATISAFLLGTAPGALFFFYLGGLLYWQLITTVLLMVPASLAGYFLGMRLLPKVNADLFRKMMVILVMFSGGSIFLGELRQILGL